MKKLFRSTNDSVIGGVCAGVAEFFGLDVKLVRIAWLAAALFAGFGVLLYLILFLILPKK
jgi:phage shock protein PspC (stress-responsive transcriptional regulator)